MVTENTPSVREIVHQLAAMVRDRMPSGWEVTEILEPGNKVRGFDALILVTTPGDQLIRLLLEVKNVIERRDVPRVCDLIRSQVTSSSDIPVVCARYLSGSVREELISEGVSYADATGNIRIMGNTPAMFIADRGEDRDPWRKGRPRGTLKGEPAARVVRTLLDYEGNWRIRELIEASGVSSGATYRVLDYLQREDLLVKKGNMYGVTDWERLLRVWSADAPLQGTTHVMACIEPHGVDFFLDRLCQKWEFQTAVTGSVAAKEWVNYAPTKAAFVYVSSLQEAMQQWGLRPNTTAPNVILLEPVARTDVPFRNVIQSKSGYTIAAPSQVAADLLNGPGREPAEGEELIQWMKTNEAMWRLTR